MTMDASELENTPRSAPSVGISGKPDMRVKPRHAKELVLVVVAVRGAKAVEDTLGKLIAHLAIAMHALLAAAFDH